MALAVKDPLANAADMRDVGFIPGLEDPLQEEMATQYPSLENPMDRGAYQATVHGILPHKFTQVILDFSLGCTLKKAVSAGCSVTVSVHDQPRDQCMICHMISV